ncbi:uncharacterized protein LTR77_005980 [Saxophila tyrrhenica]|uniref:UBR-type domain-containing protein n=1 Tax=Saxophila tyrrhenica TaxID=1690608 RepID=A0AAV9P6V4_9PEZI|nr:hypothetical protein LTR77_005980 [Saxophila tyrrhenica]
MDSSDQSTALPRTAPNLSATSSTSQTAADYINTQLSLEADAREALPYQFDTCTYPLGPLRQSIYACLTCSPPPASKYQQHTPAGVCYSCSISCHGEHNLVELFAKRDFVCDCGTTRLANSSTPCSLRHNAETGRKGDVKGDKAREGNSYNQNFEGKFCGCGEEYDPELEKGTMFQCLGLGTVEDGGCGEDWWHPDCLMGLPRVKHEPKPKVESNGALETVKEEGESGEAQTHTNGEENSEHAHDDAPLPPGFPEEDDFEHLICYKCVNAFPWIKAYAKSPGFLIAGQPTQTNSHQEDVKPTTPQVEPTASLKRKAEVDPEDEQEVKRTKSDPSIVEAPAAISQPPAGDSSPKHATLPPAPSMTYPTLFLKDSFRDTFCRCPTCFPLLSKHRQLLEEEDSYSPPVSESDHAEGGDNQSVTGRSVNSGSLLERGEAALSGMDRVRAIEGVMAYNHVRDKVKQFLQPFAESGTPVGAEDIKAYFAQLRGDEAGARTEVEAGGGVEGDGRREQGGY